MSLEKLERLFSKELHKKKDAGTLKGRESVVRAVLPAHDGKGPRFLIEGRGDTPFLRMNSNGYLGLSFRDEVIEAEGHAGGAFGTGPGAVRFISGTWSPHVELEARLAAFHGREAAMIFSSAYATVMGCLPQLISNDTAVISDELNHNCIINAIRLAGRCDKRIYPHLDMGALEHHLKEASQAAQRAVIVTDGVFSMRGDHAPLEEIGELARQYDQLFPQGVVTVVDDSHGVGAFGETGRGTEEFTGAGACDLLVGTLGKAFGVNGGYVATSERVVEYMRETSPFYIYSNPITPSEAAAAAKAVDFVDSARGRQLLDHLREMTCRFKAGLQRLGLETISGEHPIVPVMVRDTNATEALVQHLQDNQILATGLNYPVVPKGDEEIRFQISGHHTATDIDEALQVLESYNTAA